MSLCIFAMKVEKDNSGVSFIVHLQILSINESGALLPPKDQADNNYDCNYKLKLNYSLSETFCWSLMVLLVGFSDAPVVHSSADTCDLLFVTEMERVY